MAAAVYAYAFLFPGATGPRPGPFDPRFRMAADLYNWALTAAFASKDGPEVVPRRDVRCPSGGSRSRSIPPTCASGDRELYRFIPVAELEVQGLAMRYRWPGIGAPLAASTRPLDAGKRR